MAGLELTGGCKQQASIRRKSQSSEERGESLIGIDASIFHSKSAK